MDFVEYVPIKLDSSFKAADLTTVDLVRYANNQKFKVAAPQFSGNHGEHNKEALLYVMREFQGTVFDELNLHPDDPDEPDPDLVKEQFFTFRRMLTEQARAYFNEMYQVYLDDRDLQGCLTSFMHLSGYLTDNDRNQQLNYNAKVKKPFKFTVAQFHNRLMVLFAYAAMMPGEIDDDGQAMIDPRVTPTDMAVKDIIYNAMPDAWKSDFVRSNQKITNISVSSLVAYMDNIRLSYDSSSQKQKDKNKQTNNGNQGNGNDKESDGKKRKFQKNGKNSKQGPHGSNKQSRTAQPDDHCPIHPHGKHKFKDCNVLKKAQGTFEKGSNPSTGTKNNNNNNRSHHHSQRAAGNSNNGEQKEEVTESHHTARVGWQLPSDGEDDGMFAECNLGRCSLRNEFADSLSISFNAAMLSSATSTDFQNEFQHEVGLERLTVSQCINQTQQHSRSTSFLVESDAPLTTTMASTPNGDAQRDLSPSSVAIFGQIQQVSCDLLFHVLFDGGGSHTLIKKGSLPHGVVPEDAPHLGSSVTVSGQLANDKMVKLSAIVLPEFSRTRKINLTLTAVVFDNEAVQYDVIFGRDFLNAVGLDILHSSKMVHWMDLSIGFKAPGFWKDPPTALATLTTPDPWTGMSFVTHTIADAKYIAVDVHDVVKQQTHLSSLHQTQLVALLLQFTDLFSGKLGCYPHKEFDLQLIPNATPKHMRAFPVPKAHEETFKREIERLLSIGVLEKVGSTEWASPSFIIPKKDGQVRLVSDFRYVNTQIRRRIYPLPRIQDILRRRQGYAYFTKIDLPMQYYHFKLSQSAKQLCVIVTPFGKYCYAMLPMGIKQAPDIAQETMESIFIDLPNVEVYIDDIGIFDNTWEDHLHSLQTVLTRLKDNGFTVNPSKCEWAVQETEWLGYWLTPHGLKPWSKKVDAILAMERPTDQKQVRSFIGAVTYYRDMWPKRSHILAPLTELTGPKSKKFIWGPEQEEAFAAMKSLIASETMLYYPDHNIDFHVYTDASDYQLGSVIMQNGHPVAYYSRKLSSAQRNYTTMEKELLSIVETLKEFRSMLLGCSGLHIYTDHRNLTYSNLTSQRVLRWRVFLEEYSPTFHYIQGSSNVLADALSRVPCDHSSGQEAPVSSPTQDLLSTDSFHSILIDDHQLTECFLNHPRFQELPFPLHFPVLQQQQEQDLELLAKVQAQPQHFQQIPFGHNVVLHCYRRNPNDTPRICLPTAQLDNIIIWYHIVLTHAGITRLYDSMSTHFYHPQMKRQIEELVRRCDDCQRLKLTGPGHGELPPRDVALLPFTEVAVDLIGPWNIKVNGEQMTVNALTCIDPVTCLAELIRIDNKTALHVAQKFENNWLARYPRPLRCIHDNGTEFLGFHFQQMLYLRGIQDVPTTAKNPQANAICERMHQTVGNLLRSLCHSNPPQNVANANELIDSALATAMHALRATVHRSLEVSPGALVFHRDMFLDIPLHADLIAIQERRQNIVDENLIRANRRRRTFDYQVGQQVWILVPTPATLAPQHLGPFPILQVHVNGTVTIQRNATVTERISIRRLKPYHP